MNSGFRTLLWVFTGFAASAAAATAVIIFVGSGERGTIEALRVTARISFVLFWPAYAVDLFRYFPIKIFNALDRWRRECGLGFAAAFSVHVSLILWLMHVAARPPVALETIIVDGIGIGWVYLLTAFSFDFLRRKTASGVRRTLFRFGIEYISLIFLMDFLLLPLHGGYELSISYLPFSALLLIAMVGRIATLGSRYMTRIATSRPR